MKYRLVSCYWSGAYPFSAMDFIDPTFGSVMSTDPADLKKGDILIIWGGGDISPTLYNKTPSKFCGAGKELSHRDKTEYQMCQQAIKLGIPIIGVCRGGQLLTAMAGGYLIQHVNNHAGRDHFVTTNTGETFPVNSIHHQMMMPGNTNHTLLAWSTKQLSNVYYDEDNLVTVDHEPELIWYPDIQGFAIQWHPEGMRLGSSANKYINNTICEVLTQ